LPGVKEGGKEGEICLEKARGAMGRRGWQKGRAREREREREREEWGNGGKYNVKGYLIVSTLYPRSAGEIIQLLLYC